MKTIVVLGAGKSSYFLIDYLSKRAIDSNYNLIVADAALTNFQETSSIQKIRF